MRWANSPADNVSKMRKPDASHGITLRFPQLPPFHRLTSHFPSETDQMEDLSRGTPDSFYICATHVSQAEPVAISVKITSYLLVFNWTETMQKLTKAFICQMVEKRGSDQDGKVYSAQPMISLQPGNPILSRVPVAWCLHMEPAATYVISFNAVSTDISFRENYL